MNAAMEAITVTKMQTAPTLLAPTAVLAKKGSLEMDVHVCVDAIKIVSRHPTTKLDGRNYLVDYRYR